MPTSTSDPKTIDLKHRLVQSLRHEAAALGFSECRITSAIADPLWAEHLGLALEYGYHASMDWLEDTKLRRENPQTLWPDASSIIVLSWNYGPEEDPLINLDQPEKGNISVYARNRDYHDLIKGRLKMLAQKMLSRAKELGLQSNSDDLQVKVFVDTAPVMEKPLAEKAGVGWQGKHTNLVSREFGSWFFLGSIFTNLDLPLDRAEIDHCGSCDACLTSCPTDAFPAPYQLDAKLCISYLTIEHQGPIDRELRAKVGNRIYGCDDCLAACPWNKFASAASEIKLKARDDLLSPDLKYLASLDDTAFRAFFSGSPIKRIGRDRFIRNVLIAIGNSNLPGLVISAQMHVSDPNPIVRGAAVWALSQLMGHEQFAAYSIDIFADENDPEVLEELRIALGESRLVTKDKGQPNP